VPDAFPGMGPLGGIYSGLQAMRHDRGLVVACDMPLLNAPLLRYMIVLSEGFDVVIPRINDQTEALHAVLQLEPEGAHRPLERRLSLPAAGSRTIAPEEMFVELVGGQL